MPLLLAPFVSFGLGALLAFAHPGAVGARGLARGRATAALFAAVTVWPALAFFATKEPAWSLLFMIDPRSIPAAAQVAATLMAAALVVLGYEVGLRISLAETKTRLAVAVVPLTFAVGLAALFGDRLSTPATYDAWSRGTPAPSLFETSFGAALVAVDLLVAVGFGVAFRGLAPQPRGSSPRSNAHDSG